MALNKTVKKKYIRPHLYKSKTRTKPKLYKNRSNKKNRSRFRGGKTMKGGMDPQVVSSTGFVFDPTSKYRKPGRFYGTKYKRSNRDTIQKFHRNPKKYTHYTQNKEFFSPYNPVIRDEWPTRQSKRYIKEIKRLDEENENSRKLLEEKLLSSESSSAVQEKEILKKEIDQIKEEINEKNMIKNKIITDLQIHRLEVEFKKSDYILHTYVIECINRLKYPWFNYSDSLGQYKTNPEIISQEMTISDEETNALEFIKENISIEQPDEETNALEFIKKNISIEQPIKEYYRKNALFEEIKDMPIIPTDFAWLLDERIVKGKESSVSIIEKVEDYVKTKKRNYKLFGKGIEISGRVNANPTIFGIISFDKNEKNEDGTILDLVFGYWGNEQYISEVAYKIFLKIWTANVIAKYIFKIYHEVEYSHIYGEIYPTIGEIMPEEEKEKIKKIEDAPKIVNIERNEDAAKEATAQKKASPAQHPTEQTLDNNSSTP